MKPRPTRDVDPNNLSILAALLGAFLGAIFCGTVPAIRGATMNESPITAAIVGAMSGACLGAVLGAFGGWNFGALISARRKRISEGGRAMSEQNGSENGSEPDVKWWWRFVIIPLLVAFIGGGIAIMVARINNPTPPPPEEQNILSNSGFEQPLEGSGWEWNENTKVSWDAGHNGRSACFIQLAQIQQMPSWALIFQDANVIPRQKYHFTGWFKWENVRQFHVKVEWYNEENEVVHLDTLLPYQVGNSSDWVKRQETVTAPRDAAIVRFVALYGMDNDINVPGGSVCLDEITFNLMQ